MDTNEMILQQIKDLVEKVMISNDPSHDFSHVGRVVRTARHLCETQPEADSFLTEAIAWLHDISDDKLAAQMSDTSLAPFLAEIGLAEKQVRFVLDGIHSISFRKQPSLPADAPIEVKIVQDADRIDAIGAIGVGRAFAFSGHKGYPIGTTEAKSTIRHFDDKLFLLYDLLNTEEARRMAKRRAEFLHTFYDEFMTELEAF